MPDIAKCESIEITEGGLLDGEAIRPLEQLANNLNERSMMECSFIAPYGTPWGRASRGSFVKKTSARLGLHRTTGDTKARRLEFAAAGNRVFRSGEDRSGGQAGEHEVGLAVKESIIREAK